MDVIDEVRITRHRLNVEQYHRMGETGVFAPDARVELVEGEVIEMAPMGTRHFALVSRLNRLLTVAIGERAIVNVQLPLRIGTMSEPEPDLSVLKARSDFYASALPTGADALWVIEVADTTLAYDVRVKAPLYAGGAVPVCWVFDLRTPLLRMFENPRDGVYTSVAELREPGIVPLPSLAGLTIDLTGSLA